METCMRCGHENPNPWVPVNGYVEDLNATALMMAAAAREGREWEGKMAVTSIGQVGKACLICPQPARTWVKCPACDMKGVPFPDEDPVRCGNCPEVFPRGLHLTSSPDPDERA